MQPFNPLDGEPSWFDNTRNVRRTSSNIYGPQPTESQPVTEPITLAQAKTHLRVDFTDDDTYITSLITQARRVIENWCCISIVPKSWTMGIDLIAAVELPYGPVLNPASVVLTDNLGNVVDSTAYKVQGNAYPKILPLGFWYFDATITYNAGYAANTVDQDLITGILQQMAFMYENRGDGTDQRRGVNPGVAEYARITVEPYRRYQWL